MLYNVLVGFVFAQLHYTTKRLLPFFFGMQPFLLFFYSAFLLSDYTTGITMAEQTMSLERAMENVIVSTEMEGFVVTREQRELM